MWFHFFPSLSFFLFFFYCLFSLSMTNTAESTYEHFLFLAVVKIIPIAHLRPREREGGAPRRVCLARRNSWRGPRWPGRAWRPWHCLGREYQFLLGSLRTDVSLDIGQPQATTSHFAASSTANVCSRRRANHLSLLSLHILQFLRLAGCPPDHEVRSYISMQ